LKIAILRWSDRRQYGRVQIAHCTHYRCPEIPLAIEEALRLIEQVAPRHYQRVQLHLRYISDTARFDAAYYDNESQTCHINFDVFPKEWLTLEPDHFEWYLVQLAGTIVHEATHARLHANGFAYTNVDRVQHERICHAEEMRFYRKVPGTYYDPAEDMVQPFNPENWLPSWNRTPQEKRELLRKELRRLWEELKVALRE